MTGWRVVESVVGLGLVVLAVVVISRPTYRSSRVLLTLAVVVFAVGLVGVMDGLVR